MADHKPWKKHAMRLTMVEKGLQYIICPPDVNSMDVWYDAFSCVAQALIGTLKTLSADKYLVYSCCASSNRTWFDSKSTQAASFRRTEGLFGPRLAFYLGNKAWHSTQDAACLFRQ